jgi:hypothetical protein
MESESKMTTMAELLAWFIAGAFAGFGIGWFKGRYKSIKITRREIEADELERSIYNPPPDRVTRFKQRIDIDKHLTKKR